MINFAKKQIVADGLLRALSHPVLIFCHSQDGEKGSSINFQFFIVRLILKIVQATRRSELTS